MSRRAIGQTKITASVPSADETRPIVAHLVVDSAAFRNARPEAIADLQTLLRAVIVRRGGDPDRIVWSAEPVGPQIELAAVNGRKL